MNSKVFLSSVLALALAMPGLLWSHADGHDHAPELPKAKDHGREISLGHLDDVHQKLKELSELLYVVDSKKSQEIWETLFEEYGYPRDRAWGMLRILNQSMEIIDLRKQGGDDETDLPKGLEEYLGGAQEERRERLKRELGAMSGKHEKALLGWMNDWTEKLREKKKSSKKKSHIHSHGDGQAHRH